MASFVTLVGVLACACSASPGEDAASSASAVVIKPIGTTLPTGPSAWVKSLLDQSHLYGQTDQLMAGVTVAAAGSLGDTGEVWHEANIVEMLVDYQDKTGDTTFLPFVQAYNSSHYDPIHPFMAIENQFNDDDLWWALADIRAADVLKDPSWLTPAQNVFQHVCGQWNANPGCGGGLPQAMPGNGDASTGLNTITNELFFQTAIALYKEFPNATNVCPGQVPLTSDPYAPPLPYVPNAHGLQNAFPNDYLGWAIAEYEWFKKNYWSGSHSLLGDGIQAPATSCAVGGSQWTYNQGPILGGLLGLSQVPASELSLHFETDAPQTTLDYGFDLALATMDTLVNPGSTSSNSILTEFNDLGSPAPGIAIANSGNGDNVQFKGIFERYLGRFVSGAAPAWGPYSDFNFQFTATATAFLNRNATAIWTNSEGGALPPVVWTESGIQPSQWAGYPAITSAADGLIAAINVNGPAPATPPPPPGAPHCVFPFNHTAPNEGKVTPTCTVDAHGDPIFLFMLNASGAWQYVAGYSTTAPVPMPGVPVGGQASFLGCSYNSLYTNGVSASGFQTDNAPVYPGATGCDSAAQVDVYPACVPSFACEANVTCGTVADGCGNTLQCGGCAAGSTCNGNNYCQSSCTTPECQCLAKKDVWANGKCYTSCDAACSCALGGGSWNGKTCQ